LTVSLKKGNKEKYEATSSANTQIGTPQKKKTVQIATTK
jgi:hypothetical protein